MRLGGGGNTIQINIKTYKNREIRKIVGGQGGVKNKWDIVGIRGDCRFLDSRRGGHIVDRDRYSLVGGIHNIYHSKYLVDC